MPINKKYCLSLIVISVCCLSAWGKNIDSVLASRTPDSNKAKFLRDYSYAVSESNLDSALLLAKLAMQIAAKDENKSFRGNCMHCMGNAYFNINPDSAKFYFLNAITLFQKQKNKHSEARSRINLASLYEQEGDYPAALSQLLAAQELIRLSDEVESAVLERNIGIIYLDEKKRDVAKRYLKNSAAAFLRLGKQKFYADAISSLGLLYAGAENLDSAAQCYEIAITIYKQQNSKTEIAQVYENLGQLAERRGGEKPTRWLDSAVYYYESALSLFTELKNLDGMAFEKESIGNVLVRKKQYAPAERYIKEALATYQAGHEIANAQKALMTLSLIYHETGDYKKAYERLTEAIVYNDTLNIQNRDKAVADMLTKYETDKKDRKIELLNTQNALLTAQKELAERTLNKRRLIEAFILVIISFSVCLGILLLNRFRIKQRLHEMQLRNRISNDLHDDVGSSLSSILLLSNIAGTQPVNQPELISKIGENAREVIERISEIIWVTNPKYDEGFNLRSKLINYLALFHQVPGISANIDISDSLKNIRFPMEIRKNIFLILKEAVNNILKHAHASEVNISLYMRDKKLLLEIKDNGIGFDINAPHIGNGLETMRCRASSSGGSLTIDSRPGDGTKIFMTMPLPKENKLYFEKLSGDYDNKAK